MWAKSQLDQQDVQSLVRDARDFALLNGLVLRFPNIESDNQVAHIPITLFPSPFPRNLYQECLDIQPIISRLMLSIANDHSFIDETLGGVVQVDDFTRNLLKIDKIIHKEGLSQETIACINRSDYMLDKQADASNSSIRIRQVEVNSIASSMSSHSHNTKSMHKYIMSKYNISSPNGSSFPENTSLDLVARGLIGAFDAYGKSDSYILLVAEERSLNFSDQVLIELTINRMRPDIRFVRRKFFKFPDILQLGPNKELLLEDSKEISVVYFRYGYDPTNYYFEGSWDTRLLIERSRAIKCPSINFHLSGAKKFQQVLNNKQQLERFLSTEDSERLTKVFCKFWSIEQETSAGKEGFKIGLSSTRKLVLKPQREGGGHNIFGPDIKPFLQRLPHAEERSQYILMEYIDSPREKNWLLLHDDDIFKEPQRYDAYDKLVSELGIFGSILANKSGIVSNEAAGYLVRTKKSGVNEGGVASGYAGLSSLILLDNPKDNCIYFD